ncbi:hypothetical protein SK128_012287, partial [Halocaridina rubra]
ELLHQGYPTNGHDNRGWRPLHEAARGGHVECIRLLLAARDADVDALSYAGVTALHLACLQGPSYVEAVKRLLCAGADPNMKKGDDWERPLPTAVGNNVFDIVKLLVSGGADLNRKDYRNGLPLVVAAEQRNLDIAKFLLERGAKTDESDECGRTVLHFLLLTPVEKDDPLIVPFINLLVENGSSVNEQMLDGTTPLMLAVQMNLAGAVTCLLELGADPNIVKEDGIMALHYAVQFCPDSADAAFCSEDSDVKEDMVILKKIIDHTTKDIVIPSSSEPVRFSIFHLAVEWDVLNALKTLIAAGYPPDAFLQKSSNAALDEEDVYLFCQSPLVVDLGMEIDSPLGFLLSKRLDEKRVEVAKFMIDRGSAIDAVNPKCLPPLVAAVMHQRATYNLSCPGSYIIEYLLQKGVDVMYKIKPSDILPAALHVSSLFNVSAFFALLVHSVPVHKVYTHETLAALSRQYESLSYYNIYPLFPWRVISWLTVVNMFVPQLPSSTKFMFDIKRMVDDEQLANAWNVLDSLIGTPKKLEQLCIITVRKVVGERTNWHNVTEHLEEITLLNEPLPEIIMDLLQYKQVDRKSLYQWPSCSVLPNYLQPASSSDFNSSGNEDHVSFSGEEEEVLRDMVSDEREDEDINERRSDQNSCDDSDSETDSASELYQSEDDNRTNHSPREMNVENEDRSSDEDQLEDKALKRPYFYKK